MKGERIGSEWHSGEDWDLVAEPAE